MKKIFHKEKKIHSGRISDTVLKADNISIIFGGLCAVSSFSCQLKKNELVGLIGPNGAGKTTVFNLLSGIYTPTSGEITYFDHLDKAHRITYLNPAQHAQRGIARTFQNIRLFSRMTVEDNVLVALNGQKKSSVIDAFFRTSAFYHDDAQLREKADHLLQVLGIAHKKYEIAENLPYGEQRKLEIARALALHPHILLLDEPAAGMNPQETQDLMSLIVRIRKDFQVTILLIEHDMKLVMGICERLIVLDYGKIIAEGTPSEVTKNPQVIKAYLGEEAVL